MGREWIKIKEIGQLYLEKILVTFDVPVLFVCVDFENRKYLCLNVGDENEKYVVGQTNNAQLIDMLTNKITMESVFRKSADDRLVIAEYDYDKGKVIANFENAEELSGDLLPKEGAFFELSNSIILNYIEFLNKQLVKIVLEEFFEEKLFKIQPCGYHEYFSLDENRHKESICQNRR